MEWKGFFQTVFFPPRERTGEEWIGRQGRAEERRAEESNGLSALFFLTEEGNGSDRKAEDWTGEERKGSSDLLKFGRARERIGEQSS